MSLAIFVLAGAAGTTLLAHASRDLVRRSEVLVDMHGWWDNDTAYPDLCMQWVDDRFVFGTGRNAPARGLFLFDTTNQQKTSLDNLEHVVNGEADGGCLDWSVSPDVKHVAWSTIGGNVHSATLDGGDHRWWHALIPGRGDSTRNIYWLDDNRSILAECCYRDKEDSSTYPCILDTRSNSTARPQIIAQKKALSYVQDDPITTRDDEECEVTCGPPNAHANAAVKKIKAPGGLSICEVEASPDNSHLAWLLDGSRTWPFASVIHSFVSIYPNTPRYFRSLWISRLDGSNPQEIGRVEVSDTSSSGNGPATLLWAPSGKRVSYMYDNVLYGVSVKDKL